MKNLDLASRPTLLRTTQPSPPGLLRGGLKLAGQVVISTVTATFIFVLVMALVGVATIFAVTAMALVPVALPLLIVFAVVAAVVVSRWL